MAVLDSQGTLCLAAINDPGFYRALLLPKNYKGQQEYLEKMRQLSSGRCLPAGHQKVCRNQLVMQCRGYYGHQTHPTRDLCTLVVSSNGVTTGAGYGCSPPC